MDLDDLDPPPSGQQQAVAAVRTRVKQASASRSIPSRQQLPNSRTPHHASNHVSAAANSPRAATTAISSPLISTTPSKSSTSLHTDPVPASSLSSLSSLSHHNRSSSNDSSCMKPRLHHNPGSCSSSLLSTITSPPPGGITIAPDKDQDINNITSNSSFMQQPPAKPTTKASLPKPCTTTTATIKTAAPPTRTFFDPWNSSSTGHQRAENRLSGSTSWRDCRNRKLGEQFRSSGRGGGRRVADTVGAGSEGFGIDGRLANGGWERGASGLRTGGQRSLVEVWGARKRRCVDAGEKEEEMMRRKKDGVEVSSGTSLAPLGESQTKSSSQEGESHTLDINDKDIVLPPPDHHHLPSSTSTSPPAQRPPSPSSPAQPKQIFSGLCMYINGSTAPLISDQNLKRLLATRGATTSVALGRRTVTHVVLGTPISHRGSGSGSGGGLAASKIQREIERTGGKGVRFVSVEWVLESVKADIRLPESRFASSTLRLAPEGQNSVYGMFTSKAAR